METTTYTIAGIRLLMTEPHYRFTGLAPFAAPPGSATPDLVLGRGTPREEGRLIDTFDFTDADAECRLRRTAGGYLFAISPRNGGREVRFSIPDGTPEVSTDFAPGANPSLLRFGLWMAFNIRAACRGVSAVHASAVVHRGEAVLCLGESGTGKSTHTRLWREHVAGSELLNDDSPLVAVRDGRAVVFGSPWSGKTPCFRNACYPIRAFIRLSQAPCNRIERLPLLRAYGALQPSFPPSFAHDEALADRINALLSGLLTATPVYHLGCLPDAGAALLACKTLFSE